MNTKILTTVLLILITASLCSGQVMTQSGRALDANNRVGSYGVNDATKYEPKFRSQNYVTGQVTGLRSFRGGVPYVASNELRITVPSSATIESFQRQSVGYKDISRGSIYQPQIFYPASRTVLFARGITQGFAAPGTNVPRRSFYTPTVPQKKITTALGDFKKTIRPGQAADIIQTEIKPAGIPLQEQIRVAVRAQDVESDQPQVIKKDIEKRLAAIPESELDRLELAKQLKDLEKTDLEKEEEQIQAEKDESKAIVKPLVKGELDKADKIESLEQQKIDQKLESPAGPKNIDADIFSTVLDTLREQHLQKQQEKFKAAQDKKNRRKEEVDKLIRKEQAEEAGFDEGESFMKVEKGGEIVLFTLAGGGDRDFNSLISQAEKFMYAGKYYSAVNEYQLARTINPSNPLTYIGLCQAYFAAGEPVTAAENLEQGMRIFPAIMVVKLDLRSRITKQILKAELEKLDSIVKSQPDPSLAMLSAYLHRSLNQKAKAKQAAEILKKLAGDDELYNLFAEYVITGKRPLYQD